MCIRDSYIGHRLGTAGYGLDTPLFTEDALALIAEHSEGIPRNINNPVSYTHLDVYKRQTLPENRGDVRLIRLRSQRESVSEKGRPRN